MRRRIGQRLDQLELLVIEFGDPAMIDRRSASAVPLTGEWSADFSGS